MRKGFLIFEGMGSVSCGNFLPFLFFSLPIRGWNGFLGTDGFTSSRQPMGIDGVWCSLSPVSSRLLGVGASTGEWECHPVYRYGTVRY